MQISVSLRCVIPSLERLDRNLEIEAGNQTGSPLILSTSSSWRKLESPPLKQPRRAPRVGGVCPPQHKQLSHLPVLELIPPSLQMRLQRRDAFIPNAAPPGLRQQKEEPGFTLMSFYLRFTKMTFPCHLPGAHSDSGAQTLPLNSTLL